MKERALGWVVDATCNASHEHPQEDVSIECIQSSEFVVGKRTNFNGPVTIINCADAPRGQTGEGGPERREENIVIRDKVVAPPPPDVAGKDEGQGGREAPKKWRIFAREKLLGFATVPLFVGVGLLAVAGIGLMVFFALESTAVEAPEEAAADGPRFYSKTDWGGKPATSFVLMKLPVPYAVVSHSVTPLCRSLATCAPLIQNMQNYHLSIDFADIGYNFLVDSAGHVYEGRGWERRNVKGGFVNGRNIDVGLIGDYSEGIHPTDSLLDGLARLLAFGLDHGYLASEYALIAANSTYSTLSPGQNVYEIIKDWPHFDPDPKAHIKEYDEG